MRNENIDPDGAREIRKFEAEQRKATLAKMLLKCNSNYDPLWNTSPQAPLIWRFGAGILGMFFLFIGACIFSLGLEDGSWVLIAVSIFFVLVSFRPLRNAFKCRKAEPVSREDSTHV
jgi:hypothetical protein